MMRLRILAGATLTLVVASAVWVTAGVSSHGQEGPPTAEVPTLAPFDTDEFAAWQAEFVKLSADLAARFPDQFAGQQVDGDQRGGVISFVGGVPDEALKAASQLRGVRVVGDAAHTAASLSVVQNEIAVAATALLPASAFLVGFDAERNAFVVRYTPDGHGLPSAEGLTQDLKLRVKLPAGIDLIVTADREHPITAQTIQGGRSIWQSGQFQCSSSSR